MKALKEICDRLKVKQGENVRLKDFPPGDTFGFTDSEGSDTILENNRDHLMKLQYLLFGESKHSLLIVLQGMDASGKDGTIRHVMHGINPRICNVSSFRVPTQEEGAHDFLWRVHKVCPRRGEIGIFNRSHYEAVIVERVHEIITKKVCERRYGQINDFERILSENDMIILKFFLHVSSEEQKERLQERLDDPVKNWKISPSDLKERDYWEDYMEAYEDAINECSTDDAPWFIVPANKKWFRNLVISQVIIDTLESLDMKFPKPSYDPKKVVIP
jgi:PPK2 family polyphosphate:nucleotide phosphotransferase